MYIYICQIIEERWVNPLVEEEEVVPIEEQDTKVEAAAEEEADIPTPHERR